MVMIVSKTPAYKTKIEASSNKFSKIDKKIADYVLKHSEEIIYLTVAELAERINTSEAAIVRFCKKLSFSGFYDLKINIAMEFKEEKAYIHHSVSDDDSTEEIKNKIFHSSIQVITDTLAVLENASLEQATDAICQSSSLEFYATGASAVVAKGFQHKLLKIGIKSNVYDDVFIQAMAAAVANKHTVAIAISHTGGNVDIINSCEKAKENGATIIAITSQARSALTKTADIILYTASNETLFRTDAVSSYLAQMVITDTIYTMIALKNLEASREYFYKTTQATSHKRK